ncbi:MAG TPA: single-stranded DNA-binding protein [Chthonomonadales bacterium]|nr:single-stranded DNA-binding protein [Chthonomonadales bacterium]
MLNRIVLIGRLTRDPESKYTPQGIAVATFGLAVDRPTRNAETGEKQTDFVNIVAWRRTAEFVTQYLTKGRLVSVEGRLQIRSWVAQDGTKRTTAEVVADNVQGLDRPRDPGDVHGGQPPAASAATAQAAATPDAGDIDQGDPFADE